MNSIDSDGIAGVAAGADGRDSDGIASIAAGANEFAGILG